jgi:hypothetical protein
MRTTHKRYREDHPEHRVCDSHDLRAAPHKRKRVKGRYEHFVWERREREQDNGAGAEEAEETDEGPAGKAEDIDSEKFWDPYQAPSTQSLKTFLRALPSGQYYGIEKCMVATDGSLRLRRKKEEGETMGAGVAWHQEADMHRERENPPEGKGINGTPREERGSRRQKEEEPQSVSRRVAGNLSSTRAALLKAEIQNSRNRLDNMAQRQTRQCEYQAKQKEAKEYLRDKKGPSKFCGNTLSLQAPKELVQSMPVGILRITQGPTTITDELITENSASNPVG